MWTKFKDFLCWIIGKPSSSDLATAKMVDSFEELIAQDFKDKKILHPIHLDNGNVLALVKIFKKVKPQDWVVCSWRSHAKCLLHGVPQELLRSKIHAGHSIGMCLKDYRVISSAIVGGNLPIALGLAMSIKMKGEKDKVWCFVGDMTAETGAFHECLKYATAHNLPIAFIVEDNGKSVCTDTAKVWGLPHSIWHGQYPDYKIHPKVIHFTYTSKYPHAGGGQRIEF